MSVALCLRGSQGDPSRRSWGGLGHTLTALFVLQVFGVIGRAQETGKLDIIAVFISISHLALQWQELVTRVGKLAEVLNNRTGFMGL